MLTILNLQNYFKLRYAKFTVIYTLLGILKQKFRLEQNYPTLIMKLDYSKFQLRLLTLPGSNKFADMQENILHCSRHG
jgi:hypothetical protein